LSTRDIFATVPTFEIVPGGIGDHVKVEDEGVDTKRHRCLNVARASCACDSRAEAVTHRLLFETEGKRSRTNVRGALTLASVCVRDSEQGVKRGPRYSTRLEFRDL
jgi:hypothetical protein